MFRVVASRTPSIYGYPPLRKVTGHMLQTFECLQVKWGGLPNGQCQSKGSEGYPKQTVKFDSGGCRGSEFSVPAHRRSGNSEIRVSASSAFSTTEPLLYIYITGIYIYFLPNPAPNWGSYFSVTVKFVITFFIPPFVYPVCQTPPSGGSHFSATRRGYTTGESPY